MITIHCSACSNPRQWARLAGKYWIIYWQITNGLCQILISLREQAGGLAFLTSIKQLALSHVNHGTSHVHLDHVALGPRDICHSSFDIVKITLGASPSGYFAEMILSIPNRDRQDHFRPNDTGFSNPLVRFTILYITILLFYHVKSVTY